MTPPPGIDIGLFFVLIPFFLAGWYLKRRT